MVPIVKTVFNDPLKLDESAAISASPLRHKLTAGETNFYVIIAQDDCPEFIAQAKAMEQHLIKLGAKTQYIFLENADHFDMIENLFNEDFLLTKFIIDKIKESL